MTAREIIVRAFKMNAINTPTATQLANGLMLLNDMISSWSAQGLSVPFITLENFPLVQNQSVYTIGAGGEFNTVRPLRIIDGIIRDSNNIDHIVVPTMNKWEYNAL